MPKSAKKKKEKVADFTKAKLKLGKGKKLPNNVVDTSFKARSIALPTQSITVEKTDIPTTKRRQTLDDVLSLVKHYSAGVRKDAILSARELFEDFPELISTSIAPLFAATARLIGDEDPGVRKTLLLFFEWLLPRVPKEDLIPHAPICLLFVTSAQTHIFPEIRLDAVRYLDLFIEILPQYVVAGWDEDGSGIGRRILDGYLGLLSSGIRFGSSKDKAPATSTGSVILSPQSRLVVLRSLSKFLCHAVHPQPTANASVSNLYPATLPLPTWFLRSFFATERLYEEHSNLFPTANTRKREKQMHWTLEPSFDSFDEDFAYSPNITVAEPVASLTLTQLSDFFAEDESTSSVGEVEFLVRLARTLLSTLTASYLDCAPVVFSPSMNPPDTALQLLTEAMEVTRTLYGKILQHVSQDVDVIACCDDLKTLLGYLAGYFPFKPAHRDTKVEQIFQNLNVIYCELMSLMVLVSPYSGPGAGEAGHTPRFRSTPKAGGKLEIEIEHIHNYVIRLLDGESDLGGQLPRPLTPLVYLSLLPSIWALLCHLSGSATQSDEVVSSSVLSATLDHAIRTTSGSAVKRLTVEFVARLLLLEKERGYKGYFRPNVLGADEKWEQWILHLPKVLWELGANNLSASETIVRVLLRLLQRGSFAIRCEHIASLCSRLVPFFTIIHPTRGHIPGPFTKIPASASYIRRLALDLSATLVAHQGDMQASEDRTSGNSNHRDLVKAVYTAIEQTREERYWAQLVEAMKLG